MKYKIFCDIIIKIKKRIKFLYIMEFYFYLAVALFLGLVFAKVVNFFKLPNVTGYLLAGLVAGPNFLNLLTRDITSQVVMIATVALGFIAFSIGNEFKISHIKKIGKRVIFITICESFGAIIFVNLGLMLAGFDKSASLTLSAMAASTAPAATLLVVKQYRAKGPVTDNLLPVVAMDDAVGLITYAICVAFAKVLIDSNTELTIGIIVNPLIKIFTSLLVGTVIGYVVSILHHEFNDKVGRLIMSISAVMIGLYLSEKFLLSQLLVCMAIGASFVNFRSDGAETIGIVEEFTPPIFLLFFVISGAELNITLLSKVGIYGIIYIVFRVIGKYFGTYFGSSIVRADKNVKKYLGLALVPQAGVAIGLSQMALKELPQYGKELQAIILSATLVYELIGPVMTKIALKRAKEISKE